VGELTDRCTANGTFYEMSDGRMPRPVIQDGRWDPASALGLASSERVTLRVCSAAPRSRSP
jgi:hypothetical protein